MSLTQPITLSLVTPLYLSLAIIPLNITKYLTRASRSNTGTEGMFCPNPVTMRSCGEDQICVEGRGPEPRRCGDLNARIESVASQRCICKRGFFGAIQNVTQRWEQSHLRQKDVIEISELRSFIESLWILSDEHVTLAETYVVFEREA